MKLIKILLFSTILMYGYSLFALPAPPDKPRHWVVSDYSPKTDPDDRVVMSVLLLWANEFRLEGMALGCSKENEKVGSLFKNSHGPAYAKDFPKLNACYGDYPTPAHINSIWMQGSTTPQGYKPGANINNLPSVKKLVDAVRQGTVDDPLYVTIWGPMGEAAQAADYMLKNEPELLKKVVFISHSTAPSNKNNCKEDAQACKFLHDKAAEGKLYLIEVGDSGQRGIDKCRTGRKINAAVKKSALGALMQVKYKDGYPDWSDGASWMVLLGHKWGILDYTTLKVDGSNNTNYLTSIYCTNRAPVLYPKIEERADIAVNGGQCGVQYTISATAGAGGSINPSGSVSVKEGENQTFSITPGDCAIIADVLVNGSSVGAVSSYTFSNVTANQSIEATFSNLPQFTISATSSNCCLVSPSGSVSICEGGSQDFTINVPPGCKLVDVLVDGISVGAVTSYTFTNVMANHTIQPVCEEIPQYTVTSSVGDGDGTITPSGASSVSEGGEITYTITPNNCGSEIVSVLVDGVDQGAISTYTFSNISADHSIVANFTECKSGIIINDIKTDCKGKKARNFILFSVVGSNAKPKINRGKLIPQGANWKIKEVGVPYSTTINYVITVGSDSKTVPVTSVDKNCQPATTTYTITASASGGGTITPQGAVSVVEGSSQTFNIAGDKCSSLEDVIVDGVSVGAVPSYTFTNVKADHTISAQFIAIPVAFTITASASGCCIISSPGETNVACGDDITYTITPESDCEIADVVVDGESVGAVSSYTFSSVTADHTIAVTCQPVQAGSVKVTNVVTDCNKKGKPRNIIYVTVAGAHTSVTSNRGDVINDKGGKYRIREIGVAKGSTHTYNITAKNGGTVVGSVSQSVTAVKSCPKSAISVNGNTVVNIHPNPATSLLNINVNGFTNAELSIVDVNGKIVMEEKLSDTQLTLDISGLSAGIYAVRVVDERNSNIQHLIIK
ncbi:MAG: DUF1593 domain-containing protein [Bacteroidales bacterium]|nr:DUF1593 domain-containing protein [Bacteroidales bacterium]